MTFVAPERCAGTRYAAANWIRLGQTKGYGRLGNAFVYHCRVKDLHVKVKNRRLISSLHPDTGRLADGRGERDEPVKPLGDAWSRHRGTLRGMGAPEIDPDERVGLPAGHLQPFLPFLGRKEVPPHLAAMINGPLGDSGRKNVEVIRGDTEGGRGYRNLANFTTRSALDDEGMFGGLLGEPLKVLMTPGGMLAVDEVCFPKNGGDSVGVARQPAGPLGRRENRLAGVMAGIVGGRGPGPVDRELFMPEERFGGECAGKRAKRAVPEELEFKTKSRIAADVIRKIASTDGFRARCVGLGAAFGRDHALVDSLPEGLAYFADVPRDAKVPPRRPETAVPEAGGTPARGRSRAPKTSRRMSWRGATAPRGRSSSSAGAPKARSRPRTSDCGWRSGERGPAGK